MEGITYRQDIEETIERYKERVAKNPEDEIAKEVLQDLGKLFKTPISERWGSRFV